jgi:PII-like signaling protein
MDIQENAVRLKIYLGESDQFEGIPAYKAVVHFLRSQGVWGATVVIGSYGYGKRSQIHAVQPLRLSQDLPVTIEVVDNREKLEALIPEIGRRVQGGLVTLEEVQVLRHLG